MAPNTLKKKKLSRNHLYFAPENMQIWIKYGFRVIRDGSEGSLEMAVKGEGESG